MKCTIKWIANYSPSRDFDEHGFVCRAYKKGSTLHKKRKINLSIQLFAKGYLHNTLLDNILVIVWATTIQLQ